MVLKKMKVPKLVDDWEERNNVIILNVANNDQRLKKLQKQANEIAKFNAIENNKSTFFMDNIVNPNLPPIKPTSMERKIIDLLSKGTRVVDVARKMGMTVRQVSYFKSKNNIVELRCYFFDNDGWMKFKCDSLIDLYNYMVEQGITNNSRSAFFMQIRDSYGIVYKDEKPIGRVDAMKLIRRTI